MATDKSPDEESSEQPVPAQPAPRAKRRRYAPIKIANQIPKRRRMDLEKALGEVTETPAKWSRNGGTKNHNFLKKRIKPGTIRHIEYDLLDVDIGESWPVPVSVVHGP